MEKRPQVQPGPKKIIDVKVEEGKQFYKVKWEPTWEAAENLLTCQDLVKEFWSFIYEAKKAEHTGKEESQQMPPVVESSTGHQMDLQKLSQVEKESVQELINRASSTSTGEYLATPPSYQLNVDAPVATPMLPVLPWVMSPPQTPVKSETYPIQVQQQGSPLAYGFPPSPSGSSAYSVKSDDILSQTPLNTPLKQECSSKMSKMALSTAFTPTKKENTPKTGRQIEKEILGNSDKGISNAGCIKIIQNFSHPYVKLNLVCKICNKEMSLKFPEHWKRHYMTHINTKAPSEQANVEGTPPPQKKKRPSKSQKPTTPVIKQEE